MSDGDESRTTTTPDLPAALAILLLMSHALSARVIGILSAAVHHPVCTQPSPVPSLLRAVPARSLFVRVISKKHGEGRSPSMVRLAVIVLVSICRLLPDARDARTSRMTNSSTLWRRRHAFHPRPPHLPPCPVPTHRLLNGLTACPSVRG